MAEKQCFKCGKVKSLSAFYKHPKMADGRVNKCKECNKADVRQNRAAKIDYYTEYDKGRSMSPHRVEARSKYQKTPEGKASVIRSKAKWDEENTVKKAASIIVGNAVRSGRIVKSNQCESCGKEGRTHGHHDDYAHPLIVRWLCAKCHVAWHKENGSGING